MNQDLVAAATDNVTDILNLSLEHDPDLHQALVVFDTRTGLTDILTAAYRAALPAAEFVDFDTVTKEDIIQKFDTLQEHDLVVLIQSSSFRLDDFRIRLHLFSRKLKVIEHLHLYRNDESVWDVYVNSLEYDPGWYRVMGPKLKSRLDAASQLEIHGGEAVLKLNGPLEPAKLNIGDYTGMSNIGGTFPIGEVFTEAQDLTDLNGSFYVYAFANQDFTISLHEPFRVDVAYGLIVSYADNTPDDFKEILKVVGGYERLIIREIGFGLNRAITKERFIADVTAFERIIGVHLSLGEKHSVYKKEGMSTSKSKFHVDLFLVTDQIQADGQVLFEAGQYRV